MSVALRPPPARDGLTCGLTASSVPPTASDAILLVTSPSPLRVMATGRTRLRTKRAGAELLSKRRTARAHASKAGRRPACLQKRFNWGASVRVLYQPGALGGGASRAAAHTCNFSKPRL